MDTAEALSRLTYLCAKRECCTSEIVAKCTLWQLEDSQTAQVLQRLYAERYVDDHRYASRLVADKLRLNHWGRTKIIHALIAKGLPKDVISEAMTTIDADEYTVILTSLLSRKLATIPSSPPHITRQKLIAYAAGRGFEYPLIANVIDDLIADNND